MNQLKEQQDSVPSAPSILQTMLKSIPPPVMPTPITRKKSIKEPKKQTEEEATSLRRSGRLAVKQIQSGHKTSEELAQEVLAKKLGLVEPIKEAEKEIKSKLSKLFEEPLPKDAMQAMEDLLKAMNIEAGPPKKSIATANKGAAKKGK